MDDPQICTYCGVPASTQDHIIPWTFNHSLRKRKKRWRVKTEVVVPACQECNSTAGNKSFGSVEEKRAYIQGRYRRKYKKVLEKFPVWEDYEIEELSFSLRQGLRLRSEAKKWMVNRINHPYVIYKNLDFLDQITNLLKLYYG